MTFGVDGPWVEAQFRKERLDCLRSRFGQLLIV
jgi:hypothetical protein